MIKLRSLPASGFRNSLPLGKNMLLATMLASSLLVAGCANKDKTVDPTFALPMENPEKLYNEALANLNAGRTAEAARKFESIEKQNPYSQWGRKAMVMGAYTNYKQAKYDEAINMARRYIALYPQSAEAAYATYIIGLSYFRQIPDITRDQADSQRTIRAMQVLIDTFPNSEYVSDAKTKIRFAREQLAGKDMQVGRYYQERQQYLSAIKRYQDVVENYSDTNQIEEALYRLVEAYYALGITSEAMTAASVLGQNYPDSIWYRDAYALLQKSGHKPTENKNSWVSKAFQNKKKVSK